MKRIMTGLTVLLLLLSVSTAWAEGEEKKSSKEEKKAKIDGIAAEVLDELFKASPKAKGLYDKAYGHAVFSNLKVAIGISGGGGSGVAVAKDSGTRIYMKMGTGGVGLGLGAQKYHVVFLFENETTFNNFVNKGWQADTQAGAAAGSAGAGAASTFRDGVAVYQITDKGLIASADISGTKYWKNDKLN